MFLLVLFFSKRKERPLTLLLLFSYPVHQYMRPSGRFRDAVALRTLKRELASLLKVHPVPDGYEDRLDPVPRAKRAPHLSPLVHKRRAFTAFCARLLVLA